MDNVSSLIVYFHEVLTFNDRGLVRIYLLLRFSGLSKLNKSSLTPKVFRCAIIRIKCRSTPFSLFCCIALRFSLSPP